MFYIIAGLLFLSFLLQLIAAKLKKSGKSQSQKVNGISYLLIGIAILLTLFC